MINYKLKLDCPNEKVLSSDIVFVSGDVKAYKLTFEFSGLDDSVNLNDCVLVVRVKRADGSCVEGTGEIADGKGVYIPENSVYDIPGEVRLEIALCSTSKSYITTKIIVAEVVEGIGKNHEPSATEVSVFVTLVSQVQSKIELLNRMAADIVPVKGTDYWTESDKAEIKSYVEEAILGGEW